MYMYIRRAITALIATGMIVASAFSAGATGSGRLIEVIADKDNTFGPGPKEAGHHRQARRTNRP